MRQSKLFSKTQRSDPQNEESVNAKLLIRAGYVDKVMAGVYTFLPLGKRVMANIENIIREEMMAIGGEEIFMPSLQPKTNWETTGRYNAYDTLFKFQSFYSKTDYVLGPTHEEIVSPLLGKFITSYKDLPVAVFQIQNKFRDEKRSKSGLLRGREFLMKDLYSFHADEKDLELDGHAFAAGAGVGNIINKLVDVAEAQNFVASLDPGGGGRTPLDHSRHHHALGNPDHENRGQSQPADQKIHQNSSGQDNSFLVGGLVEEVALFLFRTQFLFSGLVFTVDFHEAAEREGIDTVQRLPLLLSPDPRRKTKAEFVDSHSGKFGGQKMAKLMT